MCGIIWHYRYRKWSHILSLFIIISSSLLSYCDFSAHSFLLLDTVSNHNYKEPIDIYSDMIKGYIYGNYGNTQKVVWNYWL